MVRNKWVEDLCMFAMWVGTDRPFVSTTYVAHHCNGWRTEGGAYLKYIYIYILSTITGFLPHFSVEIGGEGHTPHFQWIKRPFIMWWEGHICVLDGGKYPSGVPSFSQYRTGPQHFKWTTDGKTLHYYICA